MSLCVKNVCFHIFSEVKVTDSRVTFKTYLGMGSPQKYHIKWYMPKCLSYPEVSEITRLKCPILMRAEKSKTASKMAAFKNY